MQQSLFPEENSITVQLKAAVRKFFWGVKIIRNIFNLSKYITSRQCSKLSACRSFKKLIMFLFPVLWICTGNLCLSLRHYVTSVHTHTHTHVVNIYTSAN